MKRISRDPSPFRMEGLQGFSVFWLFVCPPVTRMHGTGLGMGLLCLSLLCSLGVRTSHAQPDSVRAAILKAKGFSANHSPRNALWRAIAIPGWGQFYNRQYYKVPFVYAGMAGGGYAVYEMNRRYLLYRHANLFVIGQNQSGDNPYQGFEGAYNRVVRLVGGELSGRQLRRIRDKYRRWRDLSIVGTGLFYALTILDAYVSAHLLAFNVGDLAVKVRPVGGTHSAFTNGEDRTFSNVQFSPRAGLRVRVHF